MSNIASLRGATPTGHANEEVVKLLEQLTERAKAGDIQGIAYAVTHNPGDGFRSGWEGSTGYSHQLGAAVGLLFHRYFAAFER